VDGDFHHEWAGTKDFPSTLLLLAHSEPMYLCTPVAVEGGYDAWMAIFTTSGQGLGSRLPILLAQFQLCIPKGTGRFPTWYLQDAPS